MGASAPAPEAAALPGDPAPTAMAMPMPMNQIDVGLMKLEADLTTCGDVTSSVYPGTISAFQLSETTTSSGATESG